MMQCRRAPGRFPWVAVILGIAGIAVLIGLGTWQVNRLAWKEALLAAIDQRIHAAPRAACRGRRLVCRDRRRRLLAGRTASGTFDHAKERHFFATYDGAVRLLRLHAAGAGGRAARLRQSRLRSLRPQGSGDAARGAGERHRSRSAGLPAIRLPKSRRRCVPDNDPAKNIFYWKDLAAMAKSTRRR